MHIPLGRLSDQLNDLPRDRPADRALRRRLPIVDRGEPLQRSGRTAVSEIAGGIGAWEQAGLPVAADEA